jgi:hypothetical protein
MNELRIMVDGHGHAFPLSDEMLADRNHDRLIAMGVRRAVVNRYIAKEGSRGAATSESIVTTDTEDELLTNSAITDPTSEKQ